MKSSEPPQSSSGPQVARERGASLPAPSGLDRGARASWLSAAVLVAPLAVVAEVLIRKTHHRPLGAATFATGAVILWLFTEAVSAWVLDGRISKLRARVRRWLWVGGAASAGLVFARAFLA